MVVPQRGRRGIRDSPQGRLYVADSLFDALPSHDTGGFCDLESDLRACQGHRRQSAPARQSPIVAGRLAAASQDGEVLVNEWSFGLSSAPG